LIVPLSSETPVPPVKAAERLPGLLRNVSGEPRPSGAPGPPRVAPPPRRRSPGLRRLHPPVVLRGRPARVPAFGLREGQGRRGPGHDRPVHQRQHRMAASRSLRPSREAPVARAIPSESARLPAGPHRLGQPPTATGSGSSGTSRPSTSGRSLAGRRTRAAHRERHGRPGPRQSSARDLPSRASAKDETADCAPDGVPFLGPEPGSSADYGATPS
jgi:hypothetical protein